MYPVVLIAHSWLRWLVLVLVLARVGRGAIGWSTGSPFTRADRLLGLAAMIAVDVQLALGLLLYGVSPRIAGALADPGAAMAERTSRQLFVEHPVLMLAAITAIHAGFALSKRATDDRRRHRAATLGYGLGAALAVIGIPWR